MTPLKIIQNSNVVAKNQFFNIVPVKIRIDEEQKRISSSVEKTWEAIRNLNSFYWDEYTKNDYLKKNENPKSCLDGINFWL